ncbi:DUF4202 domain-containing protein [Oceanimonas sp. CHS3-5]|uniref:DUF4202 domain-containing protein n=1 Tax=Oceanimonas sp. CHS3-5 TaxID=3068186 RepID=UPI00273F7993|nr:DUF4202 domain-containing protein [Oceanimonas sp. CHS3-5]MDP5292363.1 DUF4202 domain-containing protein [Oceanimonas sp. CHS3-5]
MSSSSGFSRVISAIDQLNAEDPNLQTHEGKDWPKELLYSERMTQQLHDFAPDADELLHIAARAQHVRRWAIPRSDYPMDRAGYKRWRSELAQYHADVTTGLMAEAGYGEDEQLRVSELLLKKRLKQDESVQTLEDVICLVFLQFYLEDFAARHEESKVVDIIGKTWRKMSEKGHNAALALALTLPPAMQTLVGKALAE